MALFNTDKPTAESEPDSLEVTYRAGGDAWRKNRPVGFLLIGIIVLIVGLTRHYLSSGLIAFVVCVAAAGIAWRSSLSD